MSMSMYVSMSMSMSMANNISCVKSSLTNISHLSDDVLLEIFIRLPSRSVAQCKCVSNRWLGLISTPSFLRLFISHQYYLYKTFMVFLSPHQLMLTFPPDLKDSVPTQNPLSSVNNGQITQTSLSPNMIVKGYVCGCSNGLLLCSNNRYTSGRDYYVYEPLTKECYQIPSPPILKKECIYAVGFACDPYSLTEQGSPIKDRSFRVVRVPSFIVRLAEFTVEVFSSETNEWSQEMVRIPNGFAFAPHWLLSFDYDGWLYFMGRTGIFVYDPYTEDSDTLEYPSDADPMNIMSFGFLGSSCGNLRIAEIGTDDVKVWELAEDGKWQLLHRTNLSPYLPAKFCADYYKRIGGFHPHDGDIVYLCSYADGVFVANLRTNKFEAISGYERSDMSPFQLEMPLMRATPSVPSPE